MGTGLRKRDPVVLCLDVNIDICFGTSPLVKSPSS